MSKLNVWKREMSYRRFRFWYWYYKHVRHPYDQWRWNRAVKVIRDFDYYVISDHDYFNGQRVGLWGNSKD